MMESMLLLIGVFSLALLAFVKKKLTISGALAACIVGSLIALGLKWFGLLLLGIFFFSSTLLGSLKGKKKNEVIEKGNTRDAAQVLANGGVAAILATLYLFYPSLIIICGFVGCLAAANADTWATEVGAFSKTKPFHLLKKQRVEVGTSGAVTLLGSVAALAGSLTIAMAATYFWWGEMDSKVVLLIALTVAGFVGHFVDSLLGAVCQVIYRCSSCHIETERKRHCGRTTVKEKGIEWVNNDSVNIACTISGGLLGIAASFMVFYI